MRIDSEGLDDMDRKYLRCIAFDYNGGPVGIETLSASLLEQKDIIEDVINHILCSKALFKEHQEEEFYLIKDIIILQSTNETIMKIYSFQSISVYYEDTDSTGFVYHTNYIKYAERARSNLIREQFPDVQNLFNTNVFFFVISQLSANFSKTSEVK